VTFKEIRNVYTNESLGYAATVVRRIRPLIDTGLHLGSLPNYRQLRRESRRSVVTTISVLPPAKTANHTAMATSGRDIQLIGGEQPSRPNGKFGRSTGRPGVDATAFRYLICVFIRVEANTYWVTDRLLAGEFPSAGGDEASKAKLSQYESHGVSCYIDLTKEGEKGAPYDELLKSMGSLAEYHRVAFADGGLPSKESMRGILDMIDAKAGVNQTSYVHCGGGVGRTGTVVGCYLRRHGWSGSEALDEVKRLFQNSGRSAKSPDSPATDDQKEYVRNWSEE
jgi:hypothetical protein